MPYNSTASAPSPVNSLKAQSRPIPTSVGSRARPAFSARRTIAGASHGHSASRLVRSAAFQPNATPEAALEFADSLASLGGLDRVALRRKAERALDDRAALTPEEYEAGFADAQADSGCRSGDVRRANRAHRDAWIRAQPNAKAAWRGLRAAGITLSYAQCKRVYARAESVHAADMERCRRRERKPVIIISRRPTPEQRRLRRKHRRRYEFIEAPLPNDDPGLRALRERKAAANAAANAAYNAKAEAEAAERRAAYNARGQTAERPPPIEKAVTDESAAEAEAAAEAEREAARERARTQCGMPQRGEGGRHKPRCAERRADGLPVCALHAAGHLRSYSTFARSRAAAALYEAAAAEAEAGKHAAAAELYAQAQAVEAEAADDAPPAPDPAPAPAAPSFPDFRAERARRNEALARRDEAPAEPAPSYLPKFCFRCEAYYCSARCRGRAAAVEPAPLDAPRKAQSPPEEEKA